MCSGLLRPHLLRESEIGWAGEVGIDPPKCLDGNVLGLGPLRTHFQENSESWVA